MHDIEWFLDKACRSVGGSPSLRRHLREELREHLEEAIEGLVASGVPKEEAAQKAIKEFGEPGILREGLEDVHGRRLTALLIEKSMDWKEKTMKTGWKWMFAIHAILIFTIAAQFAFCCSLLVLIYPRFVSVHADLELDIHTFFVFLINAGDFFLRWSLLFLAPIAIGWYLFERKCRSENKTLIRLACLVLASLLMFLITFVMSGPLIVQSLLLIGAAYNATH